MIHNDQALSFTREQISYVLRTGSVAGRRPFR